MEMKIVCCFFIQLLLALLVTGTPVAEGQGGKNVVCYFSGMSAKSPRPEMRFFPEDLDVSICTHVVYSRAQVSEDLHVVPGFKEVDISEDGGLGLFDRTVALKERNPDLKVILEVYDYDGELKKEASTHNREALSTFARNVADFVQTRRFDGVFFRVRNYEAFEETVPFLHEELSRRGLMLISIIMSLDSHFSRDHAMTADFSRNFDLIVDSSYWKMPRETTGILSSIVELEREIDRYAASGIPLEKLVVPIPAISRSQWLCDQKEHGINSRACSPADGRHADPILYHWQVMKKLANSAEEWVVTRDEESGMEYGYSKAHEWMSFEDPVSVRAKAALVLNRHLGGIAIINSDMEDFKGVYTENGETFHLTRAAYKALHGE